MPFAIGAVLPIVLLLTGVLRFRRDVFWLALYLQALVYLFLAPNLATRELPDGVIRRYQWLEWWLLGLFIVPATAIYTMLARRLGRHAGPPRRFELNPSGSALVAGLSLALAAGYLWVAFNRDLLYRRLGWEGLAEAQLQLSLVEFGFYRTFIELGPFLLAVQLLALRTTSRGQGLRVLWTSSVVVTTLAFGLHVLVNSRLAAILLVVLVGSILVVTATEDLLRRPERILALVAAVLVGFYGLRVVENVRVSIAAGGSALDPQNLLLGRDAAGGGEEAYYWRLNGVDLMALSADNLERQGPAHGALWAVPALLALDPVVRTSVTEQLKRATLTTAKTFMLLRYVGLALPDYYSCMLTDAYGNFGRAGFVLVAVVLGGLAAAVGWGLGASTSPAMAIVACFWAVRTLPFEQEFVTLLVSWVKLLPVVVLVVLARPLRRADAVAG
jgi:hypothetical protein